MADPDMTPGPVEKTVTNTSPLTNGTWVLVADGQKALLLENVGDADYPVLEVRREDHQDNPPDHEQGTERPGRYRDGGPGHKSAMDEGHWHRIAEERFAHDLADMLFRRAERHRFERIILVAGPRLLGELRPHLHKTVKDRVVGEVGLNLTHQPVDEMATRISAALTKS